MGSKADRNCSDQGRDGIKKALTRPEGSHGPSNSIVYGVMRIGLQTTAEIVPSRSQIDVLNFIQEISVTSRFEYAANQNHLEREEEKRRQTHVFRLAFLVVLTPNCPCLSAGKVKDNQGFGTDFLEPSATVI